jgi:hypothetical protein
MPPEGNLIRPASRPPAELLRSLGRKEDVDEVHTRFGVFLSEKVSPGAFERDRGGTPFLRERAHALGRVDQGKALQFGLQRLQRRLRLSVSGESLGGSDI